MGTIDNLFVRCVAEVLGPERKILTSDDFFEVLQHIGRNYRGDSRALGEMARLAIDGHKKDRPTQEIKKADYFVGIKGSFDSYGRRYK